MVRRGGTGPVNGKSRSGCKRCKRQRLKCDEGRPTCNRCFRVDAVCDYAPTKVQAMEYTRSRRLMPASSEVAAPSRERRSPVVVDIVNSRIPRSPTLLVDLTAGEKMYYERFQSHVGRAFSQRGHPDGFWTRTAPRDGLQDPCIRQCLVAVGALDCALESYGQTPGRKVAFYRVNMRGCSDITRRHLTQASLSYGKALSILRSRLSGTTHAITRHDSTTAISEDRRTSRAALVASILFVLYEAMQGNGEAMHQINTTFVKAFERKLLQNLNPSNDPGSCPWRTVTGLDDFGIDQGSRFLLRNMALRGLVCPRYPDQPKMQAMQSLQNDGVYIENVIMGLKTPALSDSLHRVVTLWDKSITTILTWLYHVAGLAQGTFTSDTQSHHTIPEARVPVIRRQQSIATSHCQRIVEVTQDNLRRIPGSAAEHPMWVFVHTAALVLRILCQAALDPTGVASWDLHARDCEAALESISTALRAMSPGSSVGNETTTASAAAITTATTTTSSIPTKSIAEAISLSSPTSIGAPPVPLPINPSSSRPAAAAAAAARTQSSSGGPSLPPPPAAASNTPTAIAATAAASDFATGVVDDEIYYIIYFVVANCRDRRVRAKGLGLCRRVPWRTAGREGCVIWETLANLMRLEALCEVERGSAGRAVVEGKGMGVGRGGGSGEEGGEGRRHGGKGKRKQEVDGHDEEEAMSTMTTPVEARYVPVGCWWDEEMRVLSITNRRVVDSSGTDEVVRLSVAEFERTRRLDPEEEEGRVRLEV